MPVDDSLSIAICDAASSFVSPNALTALLTVAVIVATARFASSIVTSAPMVAFSFLVDIVSASPNSEVAALVFLAAVVSLSSAPAALIVSLATFVSALASVFLSFVNAFDARTMPPAATSKRSNDAASASTCSGVVLIRSDAVAVGLLIVI